MSATSLPISGRVLVMGATGYVGGRLLHALEAQPAALRAAARRPENLAGRVGAHTEIVRADCHDRASLDHALHGVHTAYYLVHSLGSSKDFEQREIEAAENFAAAARSAGVRRIVYLGGLGGDGQLSAHLRSRHRTGEILRASGVPTIEFRASIIIGSGSLSFEMIRALVERLPVMVTPRWVRTEAQPIAIEDVILYLVEVLAHPANETRVYEIGGADRVSYGEIMREYARQRDLTRLMIPVPILSPRLSSLWLGLVTPIYARIGRKLVDGLRNPTVVRDASARLAFHVQPRGIREAIARALVSEDLALAETRWSDARSAGGEGGDGGTHMGRRLVDSRECTVPVPPERAFTPIRRLGGAVGWYHANMLWSLRGFLDLLVGGVGMRRGRRDPEQLRPGDVLDFWRVEAFESDRRLRLRAEMKLPGRAWLEFTVAPLDGGSVIRQTALFDPVGLLGLVYWYALWPLHRFVFAGMLRNIARRATGVRQPAQG